MRRSNLMVLLGAAFFVLGCAIVLLVLRDDGSATAEAAPAVAATDLAAPDPAAAEPVSMRQQAGIEVPEGMEAVAVQVDFVAGGAGYVAPGDRVNLWSVIEKTSPLDEGNQAMGPGFRAPRTDLLLSNVEVLDVSSEVAPRRAGDDPDAVRPAGEALTYLLAVDTTAASRTIFATSFGDLYLTLVREDAQPASVPAVDFTSILR